MFILGDDMMILSEDLIHATLSSELDTLALVLVLEYLQPFLANQCYVAKQFMYTVVEYSRKLLRDT